MSFKQKMIVYGFSLMLRGQVEGWRHRKKRTELSTNPSSHLKKLKKKNFANGEWTSLSPKQKEGKFCGSVASPVGGACSSHIKSLVNTTTAAVLPIDKRTWVKKTTPHFSFLIFFSFLNLFSFFGQTREAMEKKENSNRYRGRYLRCI